jgi:AraC-like DNA-binding protein
VQATTTFYRFHLPSPPLNLFVERFWSCSDATVQPRERILPSGAVELVFNLGDDELWGYDPSHPGEVGRLSGAVVVGPHGRFAEMAPSERASILGVHFRPGGAFPFLGLPVGELAETGVDLDALWGRAAVELRAQLCEAATPEERFLRLEQALVARLTAPPERHAAVQSALALFARADRRVRVRDVARWAELSQRRFIQLFRAEVGLTPKLYSRIQRFHRARASERATPAPDWAQIALDSGYFDQSHLIRDFQAFAGLTPEAYLRSEHVVHRHQAEPGQVNFVQDELLPHG